MNWVALGIIAFLLLWIGTFILWIVYKCFNPNKSDANLELNPKWLAINKKLLPFLDKLVSIFAYLTLFIVAVNVVVFVKIILVL
jgi:hypothetical protein